MKSPISYSFPYEYLKCDYCGGTIGIFERNECKCHWCGKSFDFYKLKYDRLFINNITGWIFPVINLEEKE